VRYEHPPRPITQRGWRMSCLRRNYGAAATACRAARLINAPATLASASFALNSCFFPVRRSRVSGWARLFVFSAHVQAEAFDAMAGTAGRRATRASGVFLRLTLPPDSAPCDKTEKVTHEGFAEMRHHDRPLAIDEASAGERDGCRGSSVLDRRTGASLMSGFILRATAVLVGTLAYIIAGIALANAG